MNNLILDSILTCPHCDYAEKETMPIGDCQYVYECKSCGTLLEPKPGDCCVFCTYGSVKCPLIQRQLSAGAEELKKLGTRYGLSNALKNRLLKRFFSKCKFS